MVTVTLVLATRWWSAYAVAVSVCEPFASAVVSRTPPLYKYGASESVPLTAPSIANSTRLAVPPETSTCHVMLPETVAPPAGFTVVTASRGLAAQGAELKARAATGTMRKRLSHAERVGALIGSSYRHTASPATPSEVRDRPANEGLESRYGAI